MSSRAPLCATCAGDLKFYNLCGDRLELTHSMAEPTNHCLRGIPETPCTLWSSSPSTCHLRKVAEIQRAAQEVRRAAPLSPGLLMQRQPESKLKACSFGMLQL